MALRVLRHFFDAVQQRQLCERPTRFADRSCERSLASGSRAALGGGSSEATREHLRCDRSRVDFAVRFGAYAVVGSTRKRTQKTQICTSDGVLCSPVASSPDTVGRGGLDLKTGWNEPFRRSKASSVTTRRAGENGRAGEIRTHDLLHPMQARYQATLQPE